MAPSATISVDVQGLKDLAGQCRRASSSLVSDTGLFNEGTNGIEHSGLTAAVNKFEERWSDKRHKIQDALDKTATAFVKVAESFDEADKALANALQGGGGGGGGGSGDGSGGGGGGGGSWGPGSGPGSDLDGFFDRRDRLEYSPGVVRLLPKSGPGDGGTAP